MHVITGFMLAAFLAGGCSSQAKPPETPSAANADASRLAERRIDVTPSAAAGAQAECSLRAVYFNTDDDQLSVEAREIIGQAAQCYSRGGMPARLLLTGAADPRGTEEYNLALGERRARAVERFLSMMGVARERISVHSVGEEGATGTDEGSWRLDRRVVATAE